MAATIRVMPFPSAPPLTVSDADRATLQAIVRAPTSEQRAVTRARIILRSTEEIPMERIAAEIGVAIMTVKLWRRRYAQSGLAGLADEHRSGRQDNHKMLFSLIVFEEWLRANDSAARNPPSPGPTEAHKATGFVEPTDDDTEGHAHQR